MYSSIPMHASLLFGRPGYTFSGGMSWTCKIRMWKNLIFAHALLMLTRYLNLRFNFKEISLNN